MSAPGCRHHTHPELRHRIRLSKLAGELALLTDAVRLDAVALEVTDALDRTHRKNARRYAEVDPFGRPLTIEVAPQILWLPRAYRLGLLAHEVSHILCPGCSEDEADAVSYARLGVIIKYDPRWPGKGLQQGRWV